MSPQTNKGLVKPFGACPQCNKTIKISLKQPILVPTTTGSFKECCVPSSRQTCVVLNCVQTKGNLSLKNCTNLHQITTIPINQVNSTPVINNGNSISNSIKLVHLNARSLKNRGHLTQIKELVVDENVDIITVSESWLKSSRTNAEVEIPGYKIYRLDRKHKGGGVYIYAQNDFKVTMLKDLSYIATLNFHQLWLQIQVRQHKCLLSVLCTDPQITCSREELKSKCIKALLLGKQL